MARARTNRSLALPFLLPYIAYVAIAYLPLGREAMYATRIVVVGALIAWAWRSYLPLRGPHSRLLSIITGIVAGCAGTMLWITILGIFVGEAGPHWPKTAYTLRIVAAGLLVPLFEEQLMRGYVLRFVMQWQEARAAGVEDPFGETLDNKSVHDVEPGAITNTAAIVSTIVFTAGHSMAEMPGSIIYGFLMVGLWVWRRDLLSCVVAHTTTNLALAWYVQHYGSWSLW